MIETQAEAREATSGGPAPAGIDLTDGREATVLVDGFGYRLRRAAGRGELLFTTEDGCNIVLRYADKLA